MRPMSRPGRLLAAISTALCLLAALALPAVVTAAPADPGRINGSQPVEPVTGQVLIQGFIAQDASRVGEVDYFVDITAIQETGAYRAATAGEQTYVLADAATDATLDSGSTDANGQVLLDAPVGSGFYVYEVNDLIQPFGSDEIVIAANDPGIADPPAVSVTAVAYTATDPGGPGPVSVAPTAFPTASPSPGGAGTGTVITGMVTIQGFVAEDESRAGETEYLIDATATLATGDYRPAFPGEQTYLVIDIATEQVIDSGTTGDGGIVTLDGQQGVGFYVVEVGDTSSLPGTEVLTYPVGTTTAISVLGIRYVGAVQPDPSPSVAPSVAPSIAPSASEVVPSPSAVASIEPSIEPSAAPSVAEPASVAPSASPVAGAPVDDGTNGQAGDGVPAGTDDAPAERPAAPVITERDGVSSLPNTGAGSQSGLAGWPLLALAAACSMALVAAALRVLTARPR